MKISDKPIPSSDRGTCWTKLEAALKYLESQAEHFHNAQIKWEQVPEEIACGLIDMFNIGRGMSGVNSFNYNLDMWTYVDYYIDDNVTLDIQVYKKGGRADTPADRAAPDHLISVFFITQWDEYNPKGWEYNEKIFNIIKKFLNMLGQKPYYDNTLFDEEWFKRRNRGGY